MTRDHRAKAGARFSAPIDAAPVISFSQNQEDVRLLRIFEPIEHGFWVDVGAGGPEVDSMTAMFSQRGWKGINIEPGVDFEDLATARPEDINLQLIVSDQPGTMELFVSHDRTGWSTTVPVAHDHLDRPIDLVPIEVEAQRLDDILDQHVPSGESIDFLKIDVEGAEASVLASITLERWLPTVIVVEAVKTHSREPSHHAWEPMILGAGYSMACFDGINRFYVPVERPDLADALAYPMSALDDFRRASDEAERRRAHENYVDLVGQIDLERRRTGEAQAAVEDADSFTARLAAELATRHRREIDDLEQRLTDAQDAAYHDWVVAQAEIESLRASRSAALARMLTKAPRGVAGVVRRGGGRIRRSRASIQAAYDSVLASSDNFAFAPGAALYSEADGPQSILAALPAPGVLPVGAARDEVSRTLDALRLNQQDTLDTLDHPPGVRAALVELRSALDLSSSRVPERTRVGDDRVVVLDARCLQDPNFAERGIGKLAVGVVQVLRSQAGSIVALTDPILPPLADHHDALFDRVACNPDRLTGDIDLYIDPAPMTSPVRFTRSLLHRTRVSVGIVHDFIPARHPKWYLRQPEQQISYVARLVQLATFDHLWTNSAFVATECQDRLGLRPESTSVIGVVNPISAIEPVVSSAQPTGRYLFAPLGADRRKNLPAAVAATAAVRRKGHLVDLVVLSHLPHEHRAELDQLAHDVGMHPRHVVAVSNLTDAELAGLYRGAAVTIMPSFDEGFSIPVVEAVASDCPVIASDHPVHRELLGDGWWLAPANDIGALAGAVVHALGSRADLLESQMASIDGRDTPAAIESNIESAIERAQHGSSDSPAPATDASLLPPKRKPERLVMVCPWPPSQSGVAMYHALTAPAVCAAVDLVVLSLTNVPIDHGDYWEYPLSDPLYRDPSIDHRLIVLGNSHFHIPALELLRGFGGAVVSHDQRMTDIYREWVGVHETSKLLAGGEGAIDIETIDRFATGGSEPRYGYHEIAALAHPLLVNSPDHADLLARTYQCAPRSLPFAQVRVPAKTPTRAWFDANRDRFGLDADDIHIGVFGGLNIGYKGTGVVIAAAGWLASWGYRPHLHLAGGCPEGERQVLADQIKAEGLDEHVTFYGYLDDDSFDALQGAVDLAVQLRLAPPGQVSGAVADAIAFGIPTVASASLADALDAPSFVRRVPNPVSPFLVAEAIVPLIGERRKSFGRIENERRSYLEERNAGAYTNALLAQLGIESHR